LKFKERYFTIKDKRASNLYFKLAFTEAEVENFFQHLKINKEGVLKKRKRKENSFNKT